MATQPDLRVWLGCIFTRRGRYGKRKRCGALQNALSREDKPGSFFTRRSPCSISAGFTLYSALDAASLPASASVEEAVSSEEAFSGSVAALSASSEAAAEEAASLTPPQSRGTAQLLCCADRTLDLRVILGGIS